MNNEIKKLPFIGTWFIVEQQQRIAGEWRHEYNFEPNEWAIAFHENRFFGEIIRFYGGPDKVLTGEWKFDAASGVISIRMSESPRYVDKCVFEISGEGSAAEAYLYLYRDERHIPPDSRVIIDHHADERRRLVKVSGRVMKKREL